MHSILIIDDHPLIRRGIRDLVTMDDNFHVVADTDNGIDGLKLAIDLKPDIILLDLNINGESGLETLITMKDADVESRIIILTVSDNEKDIVDTLRAGADGYLLKDMEPEDMLLQLNQAANGHMTLSPKISALVIRGLHEEKLSASRNKIALTTREGQILKLISKGLSNKHIARKLDIAEGTVKVHVKNLLKKLNLRSRVEAAVWVIENKNQSLLT